MFVENPERRHYPKKLKDMAIKLYTDGVSIAAISRSLEVPYETVRSWIRAAGELAIKKLEARKNILIKKNLTKQD
nr:transposase [Hydrogenothermus marinus]